VYSQTKKWLKLLRPKRSQLTEKGTPLVSQMTAALLNMSKRVKERNATVEEKLANVSASVKIQITVKTFGEASSFPRIKSYLFSFF
jgi:hypothetical protein